MGKGRIRCWLFGHNNSNTCYYDGTNVRSVCLRCNAKLIRDSSVAAGWRVDTNIEKKE
jgi:hypothetical protein